MRAFTLLVALLLTVSAVAFLATAPPAQAATTNLSGLLIESAGSTSAFGGGDYRFIQFGNDSAFGVVWGNATHANNIYVVAIKARYLGVGQAYWANGTQLVTNQPIKVYTIYAAQLQNLTEYRDNTNDGVANYTRTYNATSGSWSNYAFTGDVGYKFVNLSTNWVPSPVTRTTGSTYRTWSFSLNATNLAYYNITTKRKLPGTPPVVNYTFHLNASLVRDTNVSVPQWNVTVSRVLGHDVITNVVQMQDLVLASVKTIHYDLKWDQFISGWTYDNRDNNPALRRLLLEVGTVVANYVPPAVVAGWNLLVHRQGDDGTATYETAAGNETADNSTGAYTSPHVFKSPNLDFGGNWTHIARFLWASNDTVDGANSTVLGQVEGGWRFSYADARGLYYGFVLLVGLNYVGGGTIVHDPTVSVDAMTDLEFVPASTPPSNPTPQPPPAGYGALVVGLVILVVLVLVALALVVRSRRKQEPPMPPAQPPVPPQP
ncbi:MAG TPA: hypothetical protein HA326_06680 [Thermoplasmata archaeon]|nr:hypothetical protein [Thermoplasmata archaeon]